MNHVLKIISVFLTCSFAFKIGFPTTFFVLERDFLSVMLVSCGGGIAGNIFFTNLSAAILNAIHNFRLKRGLVHRKKVFTRFNRRIITVKQKFGLAGLAFITPILLSTPVGAFLAERFYKDKRKIMIYLSAATLFWGFALYFILIFFHGSLKGWLI
ncbi:hypothetical protein [Aurantibacillus circumpalustris]|uniref:hypothetical protein n=1 Tax=Aurantibacillus circumpalustris TaxID=3036359 RepID=UPI00295BE6CE|nr:hypothetical protein [Aurantibacillus circumpalustris]